MNQTVSLLKPLRVGSTDLRNRVVMAPMTRLRALDGVPNHLMSTYYAQRASAGLIVTECTAVHPTSAAYINSPGIFSIEQIEGWRLTTDAVHAEGGKIFLQLWHSGRVAHESLMPEREIPWAPSAIAGEGKLRTLEGEQPLSTPREMTLEDIEQVVQAFGEGAANAMEAGFDGVEVHGAFGYLIEQFLADGSNKRTDSYGGSIPNRARFLCEVLDAIAPHTGPKLGLKLSPSNTMYGTHCTDRESLFSHVLEECNQRDLAYVHIMQPLEHDRGTENIIPDTVAFARLRYDGILIANGGYDSDSSESALSAKQCDAVSFGTSFIANPSLPEKLLSGDELAVPDFSSVYGVPGRPLEQGYTDYPA